MKRISLAALALVATSACHSTPQPSSTIHALPDRDPVKTKQIATNGDTPEAGEWGIVGSPNPSRLERKQYTEVVGKVTGMLRNRGLQRQVQRRGLALVNVMWEDVGRAEGSSLGPNITDLTLQVRHSEDGKTEKTALMPVIRLPNFSDRTADIPANRFFVRVGNQRDKDKLVSVPLTKMLSNIKRYAARPWTIEGDGNLLAKRDTHFLVSAQAVFLPIPKRGKAEFNPVAFNYQSAPGSPAVLSILVTRQGTSMTVVENRAEDPINAGWGQDLYFNNEGKRAAFTAERFSAVKRRIASQGGPKTADDKSALQKGADVLFLIQVPLKHKNRGHLGVVAYGAAGPTMAEADAAMPPAAKRAGPGKSDVERAVVGHGKNRGKFTEGAGLKLERDERFPIRVTVQFYKATSNGVVSEADLDSIAKSIGGVYEHADFVGSLVLPRNDALRPTAWNNIPAQWFPW